MDYPDQLTLPQVRAYLAERHGLSVTLGQVRRWATARLLPGVLHGRIPGRPHAVHLWLIDRAALDRQVLSGDLPPGRRPSGRRPGYKVPAEVSLARTLSARDRLCLDCSLPECHEQSRSCPWRRAGPPSQQPGYRLAQQREKRHRRRQAAAAAAVPTVTETSRKP